MSTSRSDANRKLLSRCRRPDTKGEDGTLAAWIRELMKRHVIRTAVIYFSTAWVLTASGTMIARSLRAPEWVMEALAIGFVAGLPVVVLRTYWGQSKN